MKIDKIHRQFMRHKKWFYSLGLSHRQLVDNFGSGKIERMGMFLKSSNQELSVDLSSVSFANSQCMRRTEQWTRKSASASLL